MFLFRSAYKIAKFRPRCPIITVTRDDLVARQSLMFRAITPLFYTGKSNSKLFIHHFKKHEFEYTASTLQSFIRRKNHPQCLPLCKKLNLFYLKLQSVKMRMIFKAYFCFLMHGIHLLVKTVKYSL